MSEADRLLRELCFEFNIVIEDRDTYTSVYRELIKRVRELKKKVNKEEIFNKDDLRDILHKISNKIYEVSAFFEEHEIKYPSGEGIRNGNGHHARQTLAYTAVCQFVSGLNEKYRSWVKIDESLKTWEVK